MATVCAADSINRSTNEGLKKLMLRRRYYIYAEVRSFKGRVVCFDNLLQIFLRQ